MLAVLLAVELHHFAFYALFAEVGCFAGAIVRRGCCAGGGAPGRRGTTGGDLAAPEAIGTAAILESEGRAQAIETVYAAIKKGDPDPTLVAILQLDTLAKFADSDNAKIVVPFESAGLLGAAQTLRSVLAAAPADGEVP